MKFAIVDLETTSREAAEAHVVEWACVIITPPWFGGDASAEYGGLVRPPISIPPETSAVHHIIDADVRDCDNWQDQAIELKSHLCDSETIAVAHNADYERTVLAPLNLVVPWICTYKAALRIWPDAPSHSNESLRYWLGHGTGRSQLQQTHSAMHDARVTAIILRELQKYGAIIEDMITWANEPAMLPRCPIGDWRGRPWKEVDDGFLGWIIRKSGSMRADVVFCAEKEIQRRREEAREERASVDDDSDIPF